MVFDPLHLAIVLFILGAVLFAAAPLFTACLIAPRAQGGDLGMPYECGMRPMGSAWTSFAINYYIYALLFISFDVDVLYLFPISAYYKSSPGWIPFFKLLIFLFFLGLALLYFNVKGVFTWRRSIKKQ